ncbi:MAG TPA: hypothetical protein VHN80_21345 [Kineosporiaceae bacterium]|nr:hypothetical protein [Kineosporiaceae bacterium]
MPAVDPHVMEAHADPRGAPGAARAEEVAAADAFVLFTDHASLDADVVVREARQVLDCRRTLPRATTVDVL